MKKAKALAILCCLLFDKQCDSADLYGSLLEMASDPDIAKHVLRIFDAHADIDTPLDEIVRLAREFSEGPG